MPGVGHKLPVLGSAAHGPEPGAAPLDPTAPASAARRVLLVCMPFQHLDVSSLGVGLLATVLRREGIPCGELYPHFELARLIGRRAYGVISESGAKNTILGEVLFAEHHRGAEDERIDRRLRPLFGDRAARTRLLDELAASCLAQIEDAGPELVGFSTSFNQLFPSLWLARLIKQRWPAVRIVLGGASCSTPMGPRISEHYPEVDLVVSGYGERILVELARGRVGFGTRFLHSDARAALDSLPVPDYEPFLRAWRRAGDGPGGGPRLAFESSRGCWWGEKHHCKFCGLNQDEIRFDAKSSERVVEEIRTLWDRHHLALFATDTILSRTHLKEVMPRLAGYDDRPELFYEVKANMSRRELEAMRRANVTSIQPGIESLSTRLLKLLDKGVKAIQNLALLKWCREQGVSPVWNLLYGIPGEQPADYRAQIELIERIPHLPPPEGAHLIQLDRFSPYFDSYREHGWSGIEPLPEYRLLHAGMSEEALRDVAYHFDGVGPPFAADEYAAELRAAVDRWRARHAAGDGIYRGRSGGLLRVRGGRLEALERDDRVDAVVRRTDELVGVGTLLEDTGADEALLARLVDLGVLWREAGQLINLVVTIPDEIGGPRAR